MKIDIKDNVLLEAEKAKPSDKPGYWAKKNCNKCYGRGVVGKIVQNIKGQRIANEKLCDCASKAFTKWRDQWITEYNKTS